MSDIKLAFSDKYIYELPEGHRFPIEKYELVKDQLLHQGIIEPSQLYDPGLADEEQILRVHTFEYWDKLKSLKLSNREIRKIGLPITKQSLNRARNSVAGTIYASYQALRGGLGINLAGGTHHAYAEHGEGFCALNDIAVAAADLLHHKKVSNILVVDLDVHQGNGTAKIFESDERVFTFSMHGESNYPLKKECSDLDIALPAGTDNNEYLEKLSGTLPDLINDIKPSFIYYQSGVDIMDSDRLGKLSLTKEGVKKRDELVIDQAHLNQVPLVITMGGGYSERLSELVDAHCNTVKIALSVFE